MNLLSSHKFAVWGFLAVFGISTTVVHTSGQTPDVEVLQGGSLPGATGWGPGDERGNGNTQGLATRLRCAAYLAHPKSRVYELGRIVSHTMPQNPCPERDHAQETEPCWMCFAPCSASSSSL